MSETPITAPSRSLLYTVAIALFVYGWVSVNIYLPILPELEKILEIGRSTASLTVTVFLIGFSVTQLIWGPLSDRFGRRPVLLCGLAISVTGAMLTASANSIEIFMAGRILESVGIGVAPVLARSLLTDSLDRDHVSTAMTYVAVVVAVVPAVAPIIGVISTCSGRGEASSSSSPRTAPCSTRPVLFACPRRSAAEIPA